MKILVFLVLYFVQHIASQVNCPGPKLVSSAFGIAGQNASYDYLIIGGGTAGNVVGARLARIGASVAVIEAGGFYEFDNGNLSVVPGLATASLVSGSPLVDWGYVTTPQAGALGREQIYPRGKTLGGSSARNLMAYQRGTVGSYQAWADAVGNNAYTWDKFLSFFKDTTTFTPPDYTRRSHNSTLNYDLSVFSNSSNGPLQVSYPNWAFPSMSWFQKALTAVGMAPIDGFNSGGLLGSSWITQTVDPATETRSTSQTSFLNEAICNTGIQVYINSLADKIIFNKNKTATGVSVTTAGHNYVLSANKEVILSGGAINSPQVLMLSGIGDSKVLESFGIPIVSPLQGVGQGLWEHPIFVTAWQVNIPTSSQLSDPVFAAEQAQEYLKNRTGLYTAGPGQVGWEKLPRPYRSSLTAETQQVLKGFPDDWPEIEYIGIDTYFGKAPDKSNYITAAYALVAPLSRGNVSINSSNAADLALVNPNWLTHPADVELAVAGYKRVRDIWAALKSINPDILMGDMIPVGYLGHNITTDAEILEFLRATVGPIHHPSCTNKMGKMGDDMAVVDSHGKVFGVSGLRVIDASIFPLLPPGHPQSTVYALASKIAADIENGR